MVFMSIQVPKSTFDNPLSLPSLIAVAIRSNAIKESQSAITALRQKQSVNMSNDGKDPDYPSSA